MDEFLEYDDNKKSIKSLNLDDFSIEDLDKYTSELKEEIGRVNMERIKKRKFISEAENIFK